MAFLCRAGELHGLGLGLALGLPCGEIRLMADLFQLTPRKEFFFGFFAEFVDVIVTLFIDVSVSDICVIFSVFVSKTFLSFGLIFEDPDYFYMEEQMRQTQENLDLIYCPFCSSMIANIRLAS